jgi:hypothetical protein
MTTYLGVAHQNHMSWLGWSWNIIFYALEHTKDKFLQSVIRNSELGFPILDRVLAKTCTMNASHTFFCSHWYLKGLY